MLKKALKPDKEKVKRKEKRKEKDFSERFIEGNFDDQPDREIRPEKDPQRALEKPSVVAALKGDEHIKSKTPDAKEEQAPEGASFFGDAFINENKLTGEDPGGASDNERFKKYQNMTATTETTLSKLQKTQKEKIRDIEVNSDSEEQMRQAIDFEILDGDSKLENVYTSYLKKVDRQTGDDVMEDRFQTSEEARRIRNEMVRLRYEQMNIKSRYEETYPEGEKVMKSKMKAKADRIHGQSLRERTGRSIDTEPDSGAW